MLGPLKALSCIFLLIVIPDVAAYYDKSYVTNKEGQVDIKSEHIPEMSATGINWVNEYPVIPTWTTDANGNNKATFIVKVGFHGQFNKEVYLCIYGTIEPQYNDQQHVCAHHLRLKIRDAFCDLGNQMNIKECGKNYMDVAGKENIVFTHFKVEITIMPPGQDDKIALHTNGHSFTESGMGKVQFYRANSGSQFLNVYFGTFWVLGNKKPSCPHGFYEAPVAEINSCDFGDIVSVHGVLDDDNPPPPIVVSTSTKALTDIPLAPPTQPQELITTSTESDETTEDGGAVAGEGDEENSAKSAIVWYIIAALVCLLIFIAIIVIFLRLYSGVWFCGLCNRKPKNDADNPAGSAYTFGAASLKKDGTGDGTGAGTDQPSSNVHENSLFTPRPLPGAGTGPPPEVPVEKSDIKVTFAKESKENANPPEGAPAPAVPETPKQDQPEPVKEEKKDKEGEEKKSSGSDEKTPTTPIQQPEKQKGPDMLVITNAEAADDTGKQKNKVDKNYKPVPATVPSADPINPPPTKMKTPAGAPVKAKPKPKYLQNENLATGQQFPDTNLDDPTSNKEGDHPKVPKPEEDLQVDGTQKEYEGGGSMKTGRGKTPTKISNTQIATKVTGESPAARLATAVGRHTPEAFGTRPTQQDDGTAEAMTGVPRKTKTFGTQPTQGATRTGRTLGTRTTQAGGTFATQATQGGEFGGTVTAGGTQFTQAVTQGTQAATNATATQGTQDPTMATAAGRGTTVGTGATQVPSDVDGTGETQIPTGTARGRTTAATQAATRTKMTARTTQGATQTTQGAETMLTGAGGTAPTQAGATATTQGMTATTGVGPTQGESRRTIKTATTQKRTATTAATQTGGTVATQQTQGATRTRVTGETQQPSVTDGDFVPVDPTQIAKTRTAATGRTPTKQTGTTQQQTATTQAGGTTATQAASDGTPDATQAATRTAGTPLTGATQAATSRTRTRDTQKATKNTDAQ